MKIIIFCGEAGCGKTTYIKNCHKEACSFSGKEVIGYSTYEVIHRSFPELRSVAPKKLYTKLIEKLQSKQEIIIDSAERINEKAFDLIINTALSFSDKIIILLFDVKKNQLFSSANFRKMTDNCEPSFLESITEYVCPAEILYAWLKNNYPEIDSAEYKKILDLTNRNFKNINNLMWHKKIISKDATIISQEVICRYLNNYIEDKFKSLPKELLQTLRKSSVIGNIFNKNILEDKKGFNIFGVSEYLKELEDMRIFIKSHIEERSLYSFISVQTHNAIYDSIKPNVKEEWLCILLSYYYGVLENSKNEDKILELLHKIKSIEIIFKNNNAVISLNLKLLSIYSIKNDIFKVLSTAEELFSILNDVAFNGLKQFIFIYLITGYINEGMPNKVLDLFGQIESFDFFDGSLLILDYYKAKCFYNVGKVDEAFKIIQNLIKQLKSTSADNFNQPIYSLVYSFFATIENHLNINDGGSHYYSLALNHSFNKLDDKSYYWDILRKCDMFFDYSVAKNYLKKCTRYYSAKNTYCKFRLAEVYFNLGTEILFQEGNTNNSAKNYLTKSEKMLSEFPNERYAYGKNNLAIYYALSENDVDKALKTFKQALMINLSNFTYMTVYLNICSCLLLKNKYGSKQFKLAYQKFCDNLSIIKKRKRSTKYEDIYKYILDLLVCENCGKTEILVETCKRLIDDASVDTFFINIIKDMYLRNTNGKPVVHSDNSYFYNYINKNRTFFAEFRFWE